MNYLIADLLYSLSEFSLRKKNMFLILGVLAVTIIAYICAFHYKFMHKFHLSLKIDGPSALPIIGNGLLFFNNTSPGEIEQD